MSRSKLFVLIGAIWVGLGMAHDDTALRILGLAWLALGALFAHRDNPPTDPS